MFTAVLAFYADHHLFRSSHAFVTVATTPTSIAFAKYRPKMPSSGASRTPRAWVRRRCNRLESRRSGRFVYASVPIVADLTGAFGGSDPALVGTEEASCRGTIGVATAMVGFVLSDGAITGGATFRSKGTATEEEALFLGELVVE